MQVQSQRCSSLLKPKPNLTIMQTLTTNEWLRADIQKPWKDRDVLCRFNDGYKQVCHHNGIYWATQDGHRLTETVAHHITHFYIYTKDTETTLP